MSAPTPPAASGAPHAEPLHERALELLEEGDYEDARELLDDLLVERYIEEARADLAANAPEDALTTLDKALEAEPGNAEVRLLKADASLVLAEKKIAEGGSAGLIEGSLLDALEHYDEAEESPTTSFGAARAAWLLGERERALEFARRGAALAREPGPARDGVRVPGRAGDAVIPERVYAEIVLSAYVAAKTRENEEAVPLFLETEEQLTRLLGRAPTEPWPWSSLSDLYEWEDRAPEARRVLEGGLERLPDDAGLLERYARVVRKAEGQSGVVAAFSRFVETNPEVALGRWSLALERFKLGLANLEADPRVLDPAEFLRAEQDFERARSLASELTGPARGYEVVCRAARGWCALYAGDLDGAVRGFLSMNELFERGIEWSLPNQLESGIQGLFHVADAYNAAEDWRSAGEVFEELHALQPAQALWANNAGFFLRDAAVDLESFGRKLCRAAQGLTSDADVLAELSAAAGVPLADVRTPAGRARLAGAADERFATARELMERSWQAYADAARLAPDDVRVVNDAGLVLVYYLHRDLDLAESFFRRCIEIGEGQVREREAELRERTAAGADVSELESSLYQLREAWGDAHQNLGALEFVHRNDPAAAIPLLERSVEIGPERPAVVNSLLPLVRGQRAREEDDPWDLAAWARPCSIESLR